MVLESYFWSFDWLECTSINNFTDLKNVTALFALRSLKIIKSKRKMTFIVKNSSYIFFVLMTVHLFCVGIDFRLILRMILRMMFLLMNFRS